MFDFHAVGDLLSGEPPNGPLHQRFRALIEQIPAGYAKQHATTMFESYFRTSNSVRLFRIRYYDWFRHFRMGDDSQIKHAHCVDPETNETFRVDLLEALCSYGLKMTVQCPCGLYGDENSKYWHRYWWANGKVLLPQASPPDVHSIPRNIAEAAALCDVDPNGEDKVLAYAFWDISILNYLGHGFVEKLKYPFGTVIPPSKLQRAEAERWQCKECSLKENVHEVCRKADAGALYLSSTQHGAQQAVCNMIAVPSSALGGPMGARNPGKVISDISETVQKVTGLIEERARIVCCMPGCEHDARFTAVRVESSMPVYGPRNELTYTAPSPYGSTGMVPAICEECSLEVDNPSDGQRGIWFQVPGQRQTAVHLSFKSKFSLFDVARKTIQSLEAGDECLEGPMVAQCKDYGLDDYLKMNSDDCVKLLRELKVEPMALPCSELKVIESAFLTRLHETALVSSRITRNFANAAGAVVGMVNADTGASFGAGEVHIARKSPRHGIVPTTASDDEDDVDDDDVPPGEPLEEVREGSREELREEPPRADEDAPSAMDNDCGGNVDAEVREEPREQLREEPVAPRWLPAYQIPEAQGMGIGKRLSRSNDDEQEGAEQEGAEQEGAEQEGAEQEGAEQDEPPRVQLREKPVAPRWLPAYQIPEAQGRGIGKRLSRSNDDEQEEAEQEGASQEGPSAMDNDCGGALDTDMQWDDDMTQEMVDKADEILQMGCNRRADPATGAILLDHASLPQELHDACAALIKIGDDPDCWKDGDPSTGLLKIGECIATDGEENTLYARGFSRYRQVHAEDFDSGEQERSNITVSDLQDMEMMRNEYSESIKVIQDWSYNRVIENFSDGDTPTPGVGRRANATVFIRNQGNKHVQFGWHTDDGEIQGKRTLVTHIYQAKGRSAIRIAGKELLILEGEQSVMFDGRVHHKTEFAEEGTVKLIMQYSKEIKMTPNWRGPFVPDGRRGQSESPLATRQRQLQQQQQQQQRQRQQQTFSSTRAATGPQGRGQRKRSAPTRDANEDTATLPRRAPPTKRRKNSTASGTSGASGASGTSGKPGSFVSASGNYIDVKAATAFMIKSANAKGYVMWPGDGGKMPPKVNRLRGMNHLKEVYKELLRAAEAHNNKSASGESDDESSD